MQAYISLEMAPARVSTYTYMLCDLALSLQILLMSSVESQWHLHDSQTSWLLLTCTCSASSYCLMKPRPKCIFVQEEQHNG